MKRTFGAFLLLAGLTGCVTFGNNAQDKKLPDPRTVSGVTPPSGPIAVPPRPAYPAWTADPGHAAAPTAVAKGPAPSLYPVGLPELKPVPPPAPAGIPAPAPAPAPAAVASEMPMPKPGLPPELPPGMPAAVTPKAEPKGDIRQATLTTTGRDSKLPEIINGSKPDAPRPAAPVAKKADDAPERTAVAKDTGSAPLLRLVNTKRITLNFEIADIGSSGVSAVDLWYTQDGRDWKKHEAPTNAKAYVVEVDEEGMYGFTLVARSGIGLGKEPPASGDQPQVWVIVDLSKPDVQLTEVIPSNKPKAQEVAIKWSSADKNLGRGPVTLSYAEAEAGPWHVIAGNQESNGAFTWKVPQGMPPKVFLRAEASDLAGNVGVAQSAKAIVMDASMPKVSIVNVEANGGSR